MWRALIVVLVAGLALTKLPAAKADAVTDAIIDKAVKAHGGADKLDKVQNTFSRSKGTLELMGMSIAITQESISSKGRFKESVDMDIGGQTIKIVAGYDGKTPWVFANGMDVPVTDDIKRELTEAAYMMKLGRFTTLKDKAFEVTALGESNVDGKKAVGIKVASKDHRDIEMFFDKDSGLLLKTKRMVHDMEAGKEVTEERFIKEYQEVEGVKVAKKALVNRDDKKYIEAEVEEFKLLDKVDDSTFEKP